MSYSIAAWPGGILSMLLVPCEKMNCGALLTSSCRVVWLYIKITNHSSTLSCLLDCINCCIDKSRITYYNNAVTSFNFLELHTQPSGDIHRQPGPDSQLSIPVRITQRSHRQPFTMQPFNIYSHYFENNAHSLLKPDDNKYNIIVKTDHGKLVSSAVYHTHRSHEQKLICLIVVIPIA